MLSFTMFLIHKYYEQRLSDFSSGSLMFIPFQR